MQPFLQWDLQNHWDHLSHFTWRYSAVSWEEVRAELSVKQGHEFPSGLKYILHMKYILHSLLGKKTRTQGNRKKLGLGSLVLTQQELGEADSGDETETE